MPRPNILPLQILWQRNLTARDLIGVFSGAAFVLSLADVFQEVKIKRLGQRREPNWLVPGGQFNSYFDPYKSLDWHIWMAQNHSKKLLHLNSAVLLDSLEKHPTFKTDPRYELVAVNEPLHWSDDSLRTVSGIGQVSHGAIINIGQYKPLPGENAEENKKRWFSSLLTIQMITMHELGHVFGLFPGNNILNPTDDELKASHCQNDCVMWWQVNFALYQRITGRPFCPSCLSKLKRFFIQPLFTVSI